MSGKGNCYDNAAVETFFKTIKAELIWRRTWETRRQAETAIFQYINGFSAKFGVGTARARGLQATENAKCSAVLLDWHGPAGRTQNDAPHRASTARPLCHRDTSYLICAYLEHPLDAVFESENLEFLSWARSVFVKGVVRRFHAASLISGPLISFSGLSQTGPAGCQLRVLTDQRSWFRARALA